MRVVFAGTPQFAVPTLERLVRSGFDICAVYTQPDRRAGRGRKLKPSAVKLVAERSALPLAQPDSLKGEAAGEDLERLRPDVMVVVAYGLILPERVLAIPVFGCVNVHASLLPRWRGAAPIARAVEAGDPATGVTIMKMDSGLDTGPILAARVVALGPEDDTAGVQEVLSHAGADLLVDTLPKYISGEIEPTPQNHAEATYAPKLSKLEGRVDWNRPATCILNQIRAFNPWPVAYTFHGAERIRILRARVEDQSGAPPRPPAGTIRRVDAAGVEVVCGEGTLVLLKMQKEGRKPLATGEFINGYPLEIGECLR